MKYTWTTWSLYRWKSHTNSWTYLSDKWWDFSFHVIIIHFLSCKNHWICIDLFFSFKTYFDGYWTILHL